MNGRLTIRERALEDYEVTTIILDQLIKRKVMTKTREEHLEINDILDQLAIKRTLLKRIIFGC